MNIGELNRLLGNIDIYLLDQILKGRFSKGMKILDAGCGEGRNTHYLIREGYMVFGVDINPNAIQMARVYANSLQNNYDIYRFQVAPVEELPFHEAAFDAVISSAVLHFAQNTAHFLKMFSEMMRVLKPGGILWLRTCTDAGNILDNAMPGGDGSYHLPDGSKRFVLTEKLLQQLVDEYSLRFLEDPKSVLVHRKRSMGVFVLKKRKPI